MQKAELEAKITLGDLLPAGMTFLVLAVGLAIGANVIDDVRDDSVECPAAGWTEYNATSNLCTDPNFTFNTTDALNLGHNITGEGTEGLLTIGEKLGILATVVILGAILTVITRLIALRLG